MSYTASGFRHGVRTEIISIVSLFAQNQVFKMGDGQRSPVWTREQAAENINDVDGLPEVSADSERDRHETHFLHAIEVKPVGPHQTGTGPVVQEVADGEQRLVSLALFISALANKYEEYGDSAAAQELREELLQTRSRTGTETTVQLQARYQDEFAALLDDPTTSVDNDEMGDLVTYYRNLFEERASSIDNLERLEERVLHRQVIGVFRFDDSYSSYRLAEGVNGRGVQWGPVDHIRNRLMELAEDDSIDKDAVKTAWETVEEHIDEVNADRAFRYWTVAFPRVAVDEKVTNSELYPTVKTVMEERLGEGDLTLEDYTAQMARGMEFYASAATASVNRYPAAGNAEVNRHLQNLNKIGATPPRILVVRALYAGVNADELIQILEMAEKLSFARRVVERRVPQETQAYVDLAHSAFEDDVDTVETIRKTLEDLMPSEYEFERAFARKEWSKGQKTQYVLSTLEHEHYRSGSDGFGGRTEGDVEHIAPRGSFGTKKYSAWADALDVSEEQFDLDVDRIGNLTLLESRLNIKASNDPWDQKTPHYHDSQYEMAQQVASNHSHWSVDAIDERSEALAEVAAEIWTEL